MRRLLTLGAALLGIAVVVWLGTQLAVAGYESRGVYCITVRGATDRHDGWQAFTNPNGYRRMRDGSVTYTDDAGLTTCIDPERIADIAGPLG